MFDPKFKRDCRLIGGLSKMSFRGKTGGGGQKKKPSESSLAPGTRDSFRGKSTGNAGPLYNAIQKRKRKKKKKRVGGKRCLLNPGGQGKASSRKGIRGSPASEGKKNPSRGTKTNRIKEGSGNCPTRATTGIRDQT